MWRRVSEQGDSDKALTWNNHYIVHVQGSDVNKALRSKNVQLQEAP